MDGTSAAWQSARALEEQLQKVKESAAETRQALDEERARTTRLKEEKAQLKALVHELKHPQNMYGQQVAVAAAPAHPSAAKSAAIRTLQHPTPSGSKGKGWQKTKSQRHEDYIEPNQRSLQQGPSHFTARVQQEDEDDQRREEPSGLKRLRSSAAGRPQTPSGLLGSTTSRRRLSSYGLHVDGADDEQGEQEAPQARSSRGPAASASASPRRLSRFFPTSRPTRSSLRAASALMVYDEPARSRVGNPSAPGQRPLRPQAASQPAYLESALARGDFRALPATRGGTPAPADNDDLAEHLFPAAGAAARRQPFQPRR